MQPFTHIYQLKLIPPTGTFMCIFTDKVTILTYKLTIFCNNECYIFRIFLPPTFRGVFNLIHKCHLSLKRICM